ncbi:MAG: OmpA family protein [Bacteroidetes bacterium]|nr:OmpA family protein [Bacteroidota bacterium]
MKNIYIPLIALIGISYSSAAQINASSLNNGYDKQAEYKHKNYSEKLTNISYDKYVDVPKKSKNEIKGDNLYFIYSYDKAIEAYSKDQQLSTDGQRKLATSYYKMNKYTESETAYVKLFTLENGQMPEDYYNYSKVLRANSKYDESATWMDKFQQMKPNDLRAMDYAANKNNLATLLKNDEKQKIKHLSINSNAQDFGASYFKDKIVFASSRTTKANPKTSYRNGKPYLNIYLAEIENGELKNPENFNKEFNGDMNEGPASFNKAGTFMAYSKNNYTLNKKELVVNVEIYFSSYDPLKQEWSKPEGFILNNKDYSLGQPALSADGNTMYFTGNMPGGFGGADIYRVTRTANQAWTNAENLGNTINTEGNEVFPFYQEEKEILFFSSDGRFGVGELDIFSAKHKGLVFETAVNIGAPLNSSSDDFSIVMNNSNSKGYFSSNRGGGSGDDDIYAVDFMTNKTINGRAVDKNEKPLPITFITLLSNTDVVLDTFTTKDNGAFSFNVETDKNYKLIGTKDKYTQGTNTFGTYGTESAVIADVMLSIPVKEETVVKKEESIKEKIEVKKDLALIVGFNPIYFDFHEYTILPAAEIELNKIVKVLNENPTMSLQLKAYTDCRASSDYNQKLSDKRAKASSDYIKKKIKNPERIRSKGYGETMLLNKCSCDLNDSSGCSEEAHQANRRTEFIILKK